MRTRLAFSLMLLSVVLAACQDVPSGPNTSHVGTYILQSADGATLPSTIGEGDTRFTVQSGTITLSVDSTYSRTTVGAGATGSSTTNTATGTYRLLGNSLTLSPGYSGVVNADTIRLHVSGDLFVYTR